MGEPLLGKAQGTAEGKLANELLQAWLTIMLFTGTEESMLGSFQCPSGVRSQLYLDGSGFSEMPQKTAKDTDAVSMKEGKIDSGEVSVRERSL